MLIRISVRTLAEFIHRRGDLYPTLGGRVSGEEGILMQRVAQQNRPSGYEREVAVQQTIPHEDLEIRVTGRVDGCDLSIRPALVEEIKTTRAGSELAEAAASSISTGRTSGVFRSSSTRSTPFQAMPQSLPSNTPSAL